MKHDRQILLGTFLALALTIISCSGDPTGPDSSAAVTFKFDAATCSGSGPADLFVDGSKVGSPTLSAGVASPAFPVTAGSHVLSATAALTGSTWPSETVAIPAATTIAWVLPCTNGRQIAPYQATVQNFLTLPVAMAVAGSGTDTIESGALKTRLFVGSGSTLWNPIPQKYGDGTDIPDDGMIGDGTLTPGGTLQLTASAGGASFYSFSITNTSGGTLDVAVVSIISPKCLVTIGQGTARLGYYRLQSTSDVRVYRGGTGCTGSSAHWDAPTLASRDLQSGFIALSVTTPP